jgi:hypothetical protein
MIEITFIEIVLFTWAVLATAAAFKLKEEVRAMRRLMQLFVENKSAREQLVKAHEEFMKEQT